MKHSEDRVDTISATVPVPRVSNTDIHKPDNRMVETWETRVAVLEERVRMIDKNIHDTFLARNEAISKAAEATNYRLNNMNDFRAQLSDQQRTFITKSEYEYHHEVLVEKVVKLGDVLNALQIAKTNWITLWMIIGGIVSAMASIGTVIAIIFHFKVV